MPTPRPTRAASVGAMGETLIRCEKRSPANAPVPSATPAATRGSAMASREPKAMRMMMAAAMRPKASLLDGGVCRTSSMAWPPISTWRPCVRALATRLMTCCTAGLGSSCASLVKTTVA